MYFVTPFFKCHLTYLVIPYLIQYLPTHTVGDNRNKTNYACLGNRLISIKHGRHSDVVDTSWYHGFDTLLSHLYLVENNLQDPDVLEYYRAFPAVTKISTIHSRCTNTGIRSWESTTAIIQCSWSTIGHYNPYQLYSGMFSSYIAGLISTLY